MAGSVMSWKRVLVVSNLVLALCMVGAGCSASPVGLATRLFGDAVNDIDVKDKEKEYVGAPASLADEKLGTRIETFRDVNSPREWWVYPVSLDPLGMSRYVIEVLNGRILAITKTKKYGDPAVGMTQQAIAFEEVRGKTPAECEAKLGRAPLLNLRSVTSGQLVQMYDASLVNIEGVTKPDYYIVRFDSAGVCDKLEMISVSASTKDNPL